MIRSSTDAGTLPTELAALPHRVPFLSEPPKEEEALPATYGSSYSSTSFYRDCYSKTLSKGDNRHSPPSTGRKFGFGAKPKQGNPQLRCDLIRFNILFLSSLRDVIFFLLLSCTLFFFWPTNLMYYHYSYSLHE